MSDEPAGWLPRWLEASVDFIASGRQARRYEGNLQEWLWRGSLPRAVAIDISVIPDFWTGYHRTYIERDARLLADVEDWQDFGCFIQLMSALTAQEINYSQLGREIGMTPQTARRWLKVMEGTYQWFALPAFSGNPTKRVASRPKGYLADTAISPIPGWPVIMRNCHRPGPWPGTPGMARCSRPRWLANSSNRPPRYPPARSFITGDRPAALKWTSSWNGTGCSTRSKSS